MKKIAYITPDICTVQVQVSSQILAGSPMGAAQKEQTLGGDAITTSDWGGTVSASKGNDDSFWDD